MIRKASLSLYDFELIHFLSTGIHGVGCLMTEEFWGERDALRNSEGERFMER